MVKKAIDSRIPALIRNGAQERKRSFFVVVGDRQKDVIVNLYHILLNVDVKLNKTVLWAYKNKLLGFTSHRKKREKKIKKDIKRGIRDADESDPFELFISTQHIRYVYYKETDSILGNTYGMCILQDFEALTPSLLARTVETVEGGGLVILLLKGMSSLKQLYTMSMDAHSRYRTEAHAHVVARFNERFILSLGSCESCLVVDDELNVLPISGGKSVRQLPAPDSDLQGKPTELAEIKESLADSQPVGPLLSLARTVDQAKGLLTFVDAISEKTLQSTVTLTAGRGRGKSAALGLAVAAAVAHGYSNIFITAPSPENLKTFFEFVFKGFDVLEYIDHVDYSIIQSTNPEFNKAIVRVNVYRQHRQTIQYIRPQDAHVLGQAELLVIDEAAAIPLPLVQSLMGPFLVFMASTINGYEGTGRSLSLKLIRKLREQSRAGTRQAINQVVSNQSAGKIAKNGVDTTSRGRTLREVMLSESIRYAPGDGVEKWLNRLLCLDATLPRLKANTQGCPDPSQCQLLHVNRDTLFSFHPVSERFLQQMMALYVASHYKNSPNDLQLMSDAPAHQLFVLVSPIDEHSSSLPDPLCVIQVAMEGQIGRESVLNSLSRGQRAGGDLIPWLVSQQFQDDEFAGLSGARIVRIATSPDYIGMGYGRRTIELLVDFYEGRFTNLSETTLIDETMVRVSDEELENANLLQDNVKVRDITAMPPLFARLSDRIPPALDWIGVSFGLSRELHRFWKRSSFVPVYLRQTASDLTGEHTCIMLRTLETRANTDPSWLGAFSRDFQRRFLSLLSYQFRTFESPVALSINEAALCGVKYDPCASTKPLGKAELDDIFSPFDLKRLDSYANNMLDYHVILDMLPTIARLYFLGRLGSSIRLSGLQTALILAVGLQHRTLEDVGRELKLDSSQVLAIFIKTMRKFSTHFRGLVEGAVSEQLPNAPGDAHDAVKTYEPLAQSLGEELEQEADEVRRAERERMRSMIDALPLDKYATASGDTHDWAEAERQLTRAAQNRHKSTTVSVKAKIKSAKRKAGEAVQEALREVDASRQRKGKKGKHR